MLRTIIQIDEEKCDGCGLCVSACHEGALGLVDGKAKLLRDDYCDGMGDCLPACPAGAISFIEREAAAYDEAAVRTYMAQQTAEVRACPFGAGSLSTFFGEGANENEVAEESAQGGGVVNEANARPGATLATEDTTANDFHLQNWPAQIKLAPVQAPYFAGCDLLIAADCTAFSYGAFRDEFMQGRTVLIGCPKLDSVDYAEKITAIFATNDIRSITVARMQVPCCGGIEMAAKRALAASGKAIPLRIATISTDGRIVG